MGIGGGRCNGTVYDARLVTLVGRLMLSSHFDDDIDARLLPRVLDPSTDPGESELRLLESVAGLVCGDNDGRGGGGVDGGVWFPDITANRLSMSFCDTISTSSFVVTTLNGSLARASLLFFLITHAVPDLRLKSAKATHDCFSRIIASITSISYGNLTTNASIASSKISPTFFDEFFISLNNSALSSQ